MCICVQVHGASVWLGASPDGLLDSDGLLGEDSGGILEVKCPYGKSNDPQGAVPYDSVPYYYMPQAQGLLEILEREWLDFYVWTVQVQYCTALYCIVCAGVHVLHSNVLALQGHWLKCEWIDFHVCTVQVHLSCILCAVLWLMECPVRCNLQNCVSHFLYFILQSRVTVEANVF